MNIILVDENDNEIGVKGRSQLDHNIDIYRVSALWLTNSKGQVLLARRSLSKDKDPGKWGPAVSGTIDEGETYEENIYKEAGEEIGLYGLKFILGPKMHITYPRNYFCQWYFVTIDRSSEEFTMQADEVDALEWVELAKLKKELISNHDKYVPAMKQIITELGF